MPDYGLSVSEKVAGYTFTTRIGSVEVHTVISRDTLRDMDKLALVTEALRNQAVSLGRRLTDA